tara:strand:- start:46 stop:669 length:624 start_codon:yes stop_codon:yes gene_type:complete
MKNTNNDRLLIFDLDGVIFNSKKNMQSAWTETSKKFNLRISFSSYFKKIGMPFSKILTSLGVQPFDKIFEYYNKKSLEAFSLVKPYKHVLKELKYLEKNKIKFSIVTSKNLKRTKFFLKKFNIKPCSIHCPNKKLRGKPYPDHLLKSLERNKVKAQNAYYFGDTDVDFLAAKRAKINFVFVKYGYGKYKNAYKINITNFKEIKNFIL